MSWAIMASSTPKKSFSPATAAGVSYYKQFVINFRKPCGKTDSVPNEETVFRRLKGFNCEWLSRPKYAMSEMAETIVANMELLSDEESYQPSILNQKELVSIKGRMQNFLDCLERMNTKSSSRALESDVFSMMTEMYGDELDQHFHDFIHLGSALYTMGIHYHVAKTLFVGMNKYAELLTQSDAKGFTGHFKKNPDVHTLRQMLGDCYYGGTTQSQLPRKNQKTCYNHFWLVLVVLLVLLVDSQPSHTVLLYTLLHGNGCYARKKKAATPPLKSWYGSLKTNKKKSKKDLADS